MMGVVFVILFGEALRGGNVFLAEASELVKRNNLQKCSPNHHHVIIPLMGRFRGKTGERNILLKLVNCTQSRIHIKQWIIRLV